jgi:hypothetical protein
MEGQGVTGQVQKKKNSRTDKGDFRRSGFSTKWTKVKRKYTAERGKQASLRRSCYLRVPRPQAFIRIFRS